MGVRETRENDYQVSTFDFVSLRGIFYSKLSESSRQGDFSDFANKHPRRMVTIGVFVKEFWPNEVKNAWKKNGLTAEQAWFGIRSIIKGSLDFFEYTEKNKGILKKGYELPEDVWDQEQIAGVSARAFSSSQLRDLVKVFNRYESWKRARKWFDGEKQQTGWKDEMDLVLQAYRENRETASFVEHETQEPQRLAEIEQWKFDHFKEKYNRVGPVIEKNHATMHRKKAGPEVKKAIVGFNNKVKQHIETGLPFETFTKRSTPMPALVWGGNKFPVFKHKLTDEWRVFYTVSKREILSKPGDYEAIVWVLAYARSKVQNSILSSAIYNFDGDFSEQFEKEVDIPIGDFSEDQVPGAGPPTPLDYLDETQLGAIATDHDGNIVLDDAQLDAILRNQPLLIDGLPGTGKTSAVAKRAALVAGLSSTKRRVLVTCYNPAVLDRLREDIRYSLRRDYAWDEAGAARTGKHPIEDHAKQAKHYVFETNEKEDIVPNSEFFREPGSFVSDKYGYNEIIIDECQDLTEIEFEFLRKFAMKEYGFNSEEHKEFGGDPRRFTLAGDPLQTLEPSGFNWGRFKAFLITSRDVHIPIPKAKLDVTQFLKNYRSVGEITDLANATDMRRSKVLPSEIEQRGMISSKGHSHPPSKPVLTLIQSKKDIQTAAEFYSKSAQIDAEILTWAHDSNDVVRLLEGEDTEDEILSTAFRFVNEGSKSDEKVGIEDWDQSALLLHTQRSIKGLEYDTVILHKVFSDPNVRKRLKALTLKEDSIEESIKELRNYYNDEQNSGEKIKVSFAFSRLYVSLTRARTYLHFFEDQSGIDFLKNLTIGVEANDTVVTGIELFDFDPQRTIDDTVVYEEFDPSHDDLYERYLKYRELWETYQEERHANFAIQIAEKNNLFDQRLSGPISPREIAHLRAEVSEVRGNMAIEAGEKAENYRKAAKYYEDARMPHLAAPMLYRLPTGIRKESDLAKCLELMEISDQTPQVRLITFDIRTQLRMETTVTAREVLEGNPKTSNAWSREDIEQATNVAFKELYADIEENWPADYPVWLQETKARLFQPDLNKLLSILEGKGQFGLILDLLGTQNAGKYPGYHVRALLDKSKNLPPKALQEELDRILAYNYDAESLTPAKNKLIETHLKLINEQPMKDWDADLIPVFSLTKDEEKRYRSFDRYYREEDHESDRVVASMREIGRIISSTIESDGTTGINLTVMSEREKHWCQGVYAYHMDGLDDDPDQLKKTIRIFLRAIESNKRGKNKKLKFVNSDTTTASWAKKAFDKINEKEYSRQTIQDASSFSKKLSDDSLRDFLNIEIPRKLNSLPSDDEAVRDEMLKRFGSRVIRELRKMTSLGHIDGEGRDYNKESILWPRMRMVTEYLLWDESFPAKDWLNRNEFMEPQNKPINRNISLLKIRMFENDNAEFSRIANGRKDKFDPKWTTTASAYIDLVREADPDRASELSRRITRDLNVELKAIIEESYDFSEAIQSVDSYLEDAGEENWKWTADHLSILVRKANSNSSESSFPTGTWLIDMGESEKKIDWFFSSISDGKSESEEIETMFRNLFEISPSDLLLTELLEMDEVNWADSAAAPLSQLLSESFKIILEYYTKLSFPSKGKKRLPVKKKEELQLFLAKIRTAEQALQSELVESNIKSAAFALLLISSRFSNAESNIDTSKEIASRYANSDLEYSLIFKKEVMETTISDCFIDIFRHRANDEKFFKIFE